MFCLVFGNHVFLRTDTMASSKSFAQLVQLLGKTAAKTYIQNVPTDKMILKSEPWVAFFNKYKISTCTFRPKFVVICVNFAMWFARCRDAPE